MDSKSLHLLLKERFGFDAFRPLQEDIIQTVLSGRDLFALLPTGGGKSLCFQLPALLLPGLTVVVSPLIALMKDQVDALTASGIAATYLNSTLDATQAQQRLHGLAAGRYRMLYVAPERLLLPHFLANLKGWSVRLFAIDEAHCISEWGHDFRQEYRDLSQLRDHFPGIPVVALTATATPRVQSDIVQQLKLRDPARFTASFNRPNLFYRVVPKSKPYLQILEFLQRRPGESGIIYCHSRNQTEKTAERLRIDGIRALPYHAGLDSKTRATNQELFLRDEVSVICATIAFGMGINKSNVRFVLHHDLPKNIESYYQETGRAGRDGLPSECVLFFGAGDFHKQQRFIDQKSDAGEKKIAVQQLEQMVRFAEATSCRRQNLLKYFEEDFPAEACSGCDNCSAPPERVDGTLLAQKFLSCVYRIREKSGYAVGLNHVIAVLLGSRAEKVERLGHQHLTTYGIGADLDRNSWKTIARQLIQEGLLVESSDQFHTLSLTPQGLATLKDRSTISLVMPSKPQAKSKTVVDGAKSDASIDYDPELFTRLRALRKQFADAANVPAYIVFSDAALRQMARDMPRNDGEFLQINGVGRKKLQEFGEAFQREIRDYFD